MNYNELEEIKFQVSDSIKVNASIEALSIEDVEEGETIHLYDDMDIERLTNVLYDIKFWWGEVSV